MMGWFQNLNLVFFASDFEASRLIVRTWEKKRGKQRNGLFVLCYLV